ncbi:hypothetical protein [Streptomyces bohaiensis]|uniref:Sensor domain-containing protein n=1 Tax=Streptomyces bohaiensis TaxID=1431344 RepID=A0ABX1CFV9_9ACTN|nr:hypothetical protein [Streptomyces bohaiensis]NJQ17941.1 hypothetical protein [Streptomyces bohaiensis]
MRRTTARWTAGLGAAATIGALTVATTHQAQAGAQPPTAATAATPAADLAAADFLAGDELPPHAVSDWYAGEVTPGLPDAPLACVDGLVPAAGAAHRDYGTELDASARQIVVRTADATAAADLAAALESAAAGCAADWLRGEAGAVAGWDDLGAVDAGDGGRAFAVHTAPPEAGTNIAVHGVGRAGTTVTLVSWGQLGGLSDAPANAFAQTLATAIDRLG